MLLDNLIECPNILLKDCQHQWKNSIFCNVCDQCTPYAWNETTGMCILQMSFTHNFKTSATIKPNNQKSATKLRKKYHHNKFFFLITRKSILTPQLISKNCIHEQSLLQCFSKHMQCCPQLICKLLAREEQILGFTWLL